VSGQADAISQLEGMIRVFLRNWEDSDTLPSDAAAELAGMILGFDRLADARGQFLSRDGHHRELGACPDDVLAR